MNYMTPENPVIQSYHNTNIRLPAISNLCVACGPLAGTILFALPKVLPLPLPTNQFGLQVP